METTKTWGVAPKGSALGMVIRAVQPELRPFFSFDACLMAPQNGPKRTQPGGGGCVAGCCGAVIAMRPQSATKGRGPRARSPGRVSGHCWPAWPCFRRVLGGYPPRFGPPRRGVGGRPRAKTRDSGRPPLGEPNPKVCGRVRRPSRRREFFFL